jgi:hypothetical protein
VNAFVDFVLLCGFGPKQMRAADFSWEAPPSPVKTTISSTAIIALLLRYKRYSVPPKESTLALYKL